MPFFYHDTAIIVDGCPYGNGTVILNDVPAYTLLVRNPVRQTGWMSEYRSKLQLVAYQLITFDTTCVTNQLPINKLIQLL